MQDRDLVCAGCAGSAISAICCFTPALVVALGTFGLSAWTGWIDVVFVPLLAVSAGAAAWGAVRIVRRRAAAGRR